MAQRTSTGIGVGPKRRQTLSTAMIGSLATLVQGYLLSSAALLVYHDSLPVPIGSSATTFPLQYVTALLLGEAAGCVLLLPFNDLLSRRASVALSTTVAICLVVLSALTEADSASAMLLTRFLLGMSMAGMLSALPVYIAEVDILHFKLTALHNFYVV